MNEALIRFAGEVRHLSRISILNIVFAALAIAAGVLYIVNAVPGQDGGMESPYLRAVTAVVAMAALGLGISWLRSITRVFRGVRDVRRSLDSFDGAMTEEQGTCLIVRMLAHYRDNRTTIRRMILVCTTGGCMFFLLGIFSSLELFAITGTGGQFSLNAARLILPMLISLGIGIVSLISSHSFNQFSRSWDRHLENIDGSEIILKRSLGLEGA